MFLIVEETEKKTGSSQKQGVCKLMDTSDSKEVLANLKCQPDSVQQIYDR